MEFAYPVELIKQNHPIEFTNVLAEVAKGNNKLKNTAPESWEWSIGMAVRISGVSAGSLIASLKSGTPIKSTPVPPNTEQAWIADVASGRRMLSINAKVGRSYYSSRLSTYPTGLFDIATKEQDDGKFQMINRILGGTDPHSYPIIKIPSPKAFHEELLLGSYMKKTGKISKRILITLSPNGLVSLHGEVDIAANSYNWNGGAAQAFTKSITAALVNGLSEISFRNKKFVFENATMTRAIMPNDTLAKAGVDFGHTVMPVAAPPANAPTEAFF